MGNRYWYHVSNLLGCALGISDYHFACVILADAKDEAKAWGDQVASLYSERFGFPPHHLRVTRKEIEQRSFALLEQEVRHGDITQEIVCRVGELPEVLEEG